MVGGGSAHMDPMTTTATRTAEPSAAVLAAMVDANTLITAYGCVAAIKDTGLQCRRAIDTGLLCTRHHKVALNRFAKARAGKRRAAFADLTQTVTVTIADLHALLATAPHRHGITVRLRSATVGTFEIGGLSRNENDTYNLSTRHCLNNSAYSQPSIYLPITGDYLVDVGTTAWAPEGLAEALAAKAVTVRDGRDTRLSELTKEH